MSNKTIAITHKYHTRFAKALAIYSLEYHDFQIKKIHGMDTQDLHDFRRATSKELANLFTSQGLRNSLVGSFHFPANALRPADERQQSYFTWYQASLSLLTFAEMLPDAVRKDTNPLVRTVVRELHAGLRHALFDGAKPRNKLDSSQLLPNYRMDTEHLYTLLYKVNDQVIANEATINNAACNTIRDVSYNIEVNRADKGGISNGINGFFYNTTTAVCSFVPFESYYAQPLVCMYPGLFDCSRTSPLQMAKLIRMWGDTLLVSMGLYETNATGLVLLAALKINHPVLYDFVLGHINERKKATPTLSAALSDSVLPKTKDEAEYLLRTLQSPEDDEVHPSVQVLLNIRHRLEEEKSESIGYTEYLPRFRFTRLLGLDGNLVRVHADGQVTRNMLTRISDHAPDLPLEQTTVQVEFYASVAHKMRDKKTLMKLGRFVKKYLRADDELTLHMVEAVHNKYAPKEVTIIPDTDPLSWSYVYANPAVKSCMTPDSRSARTNPNSAEARAMQAYAIGDAIEWIRSEAAKAKSYASNSARVPFDPKLEARRNPQAHADLEGYYLRKADALRRWLETAPRLALVVMYNTKDTNTTNNTTQPDSQADPSRWLETSVVARAVVNTTNKTYNKVYGDTRLVRWLQDNGYRHDMDTTFGALLFVEERATLELVRDINKIIGHGSYLNTPFVDGSVYGLVLDHVTLPDESSPFVDNHRTGVMSGYQSRWFVVEVMQATDDEDYRYADNGDQHTNVLSLRETDNRSYTIWEP